MPSLLQTLLQCAVFSLPVLFNHIHKVGICLFSDVFEPQREEGRLIQTHSPPSSFLLQHFIKWGLTVAQLFFLWRTQKSVLGLWTMSSWSLHDRKQNRHREREWSRKQTGETERSWSQKELFSQHIECLPGHAKDLPPPALESLTSARRPCLFRSCPFAFYVPLPKAPENKAHIPTCNGDQPQSKLHSLIFRSRLSSKPP